MHLNCSKTHVYDVSAFPFEEFSLKTGLTKIKSTSRSGQLTVVIFSNYTHITPADVVSASLQIPDTYNPFIATGSLH